MIVAPGEIVTVVCILSKVDLLVGPMCGSARVLSCEACLYYVRRCVSMNTGGEGSLYCNAAFLNIKIIIITLIKHRILLINPPPQMPPGVWRGKLFAYVHSQMNPLTNAKFCPNRSSQLPAFPGF